MERLVALVLASLLGLPLAARAAQDACKGDDLRAFVSSDAASPICRSSRPRFRPRPICHAMAPRRCAASIKAETEALLSLPGPRSRHWAARWLWRQARCQHTIARAGRRFLLARLRERLRGERSYEGSQQHLDAIAQGDCDVRVARGPWGSILPRLGEPCAQVVGDVGEKVDTGRVVVCLRRALGRLVDRVAPQPLRPNIIVVMTDDQRWDTLEYMPRVMDRLVDDGIQFTESFVTTPLCAPSRASFFSGQFAHTTGIRGNRPPYGGASLFDASSTFVTELQRAGYATALFGKYLNATDLLEAVPPGWDIWHAFVKDGANFFNYDLNQDGTIVHYGNAEYEYSTDLLRERALEYVTDNADRPFFLLYAPYAPHFAGGFFSTIPAPRHVGAFAGLEPWRPESYREPDVSDKPPHVQNAPEFLWERFESSGKHDGFRIQQLESLLAVDEAVDALLDLLDSLAIADHTLIVFTSDNGYQWLEHRLSGKTQAYEESIRVPLVLRYPLLVPVPRQDSHIVVNLDLAPTFLELGGAGIPDELAGRSLVGLLVNPEAVTDWREDFLGEQWKLEMGIFDWIFPSSTNTFVRNGAWKYVEHEPWFPELYHLPSDPLELENRAFDPEFGDVLNEMVYRLRELRGD